jgi:hypothetical protein
MLALRATRPSIPRLATERRLSAERTISRAVRTALFALAGFGGLRGLTRWLLAGVVALTAGNRRELAAASWGFCSPGHLFVSSQQKLRSLAGTAAGRVVLLVAAPKYSMR